MVQRDLLNAAGDVIIDIAHDIAHLKRLECEDHHAADHQHGHAVYLSRHEKYESHGQHSS